MAQCIGCSRFSLKLGGKLGPHGFGRCGLPSAKPWEFMSATAERDCDRSLATDATRATTGVAWLDRQSAARVAHLRSLNTQPRPA